MSMPPEPDSGTGNPLTNRIAGVPGFVWLIGAAVLAYFFFSRSGSSTGSGGTSTAGATGSGTTTAQGGTTTIDTGAVQVSVNANGSGGPGTTNTQPSPPTPSQSKSVSDLQAVTQGTHEVISWRPPQFPSEAGTPTTYQFSISPPPKGGSGAAHNIGSRTSYNVGNLIKGTKYTATVTPNISGGVPQTTSFTY